MRSTSKYIATGKRLQLHNAAENAVLIRMNVQILWMQMAAYH